MYRDREHQQNVAIEALTPDLRRRRAGTPELGDLPEIRPGTAQAERQTILFDAEIRSGQRAVNRPALPSIPQLRRILTNGPDCTEAISTVSNGSIYRFLS